MSFIRHLLGLALLLAATSSAAALMGDRSAFTQGTWWDPSKSGNGFEIFNAGDQVAVTWYTFDDSGRPTWYTAQGLTSTLGTQTWPLLKHRWANGRKAGYSAVGTLRLALRHAESADLSWEIGTQKGTWTIKPFALSGVVNEIDRSGTWFDPSNSGWGLTIAEQGDVLGGALFAYDSAGEPTWFAGYERSRSVELFAVTGSCPACTYVSPTTRSVGRISFDSIGETQLTVHSNLSVGVAAGVAIDGARLNQLSRPAYTRPADRQLASFEHELPLKAYLDAGMLNVVSPPGSDFSPAPAMSPYSSTNLQEAGVDEADLVKSNGRYVYTFAHAANGPRIPAIRIARIGDEGTSLEVRGSVALTKGSMSTLGNAGLYLDGDNLVAVTGSYAQSYISPWAVSGAWMRGTTSIEVMSVANPDMPATKWAAEIDGYVIASRRIGQRLYVVSRFVPNLPGFVLGANYPPYLAANQQILASTPVTDMLPKIRVNGTSAIGAVSASNVYAPPQGGRRAVADMILVTAIDLGVPRVTQAIAIVGQADAVYVSTTSLFLASSRYEYRSVTFGTLLPDPGFYTTDIHQLRLGADAMSIVGSASLEGYLGTETEKATFRLSEHEGRLRAVTSSLGMWSGPTKNRLTILEPSTVSPGLLKTISILPNAQRPDSLGKPGEMLYATRFLGDRLYAVTFRRIDPLYVVDLANSVDPKITGVLEVPGFSEYLHPLPNGMLLGFGRETTDAGAPLGLQLSLFDVSNAGQPRQVQSVTMGKVGSDSALLRDHHAFSALPLSGGSVSIALPARLSDNYNWLESGLMRFEVRGTGPADARLVEMPNLITHTPAMGPMSYSDPASYSGRSILFRDGTIYVGSGQFWRQDTAGRAFGPY